MVKKIGIKKIVTNIPYDSFISQIDSLVGKVKNVTLDVSIVSKKIYEEEDYMYVLLTISDSSGEMSALLVGNRDADFQTLVKDIRFGLKYRIVGNVAIIRDPFNDDLPFLDVGLYKWEKTKTKEDNAC